MTLNISSYKKFVALLLTFAFILFSFAQKPKKLGLVFDETTYNFGDVEMWENQPALFTFTNKSNQAITILPIFSENDLEVIFPEKPIYPNESFTVKAIYYTAGKGSFSRKFPLYFSMIPEPITLTIKGNIKSLSPTAYIQCPTAKPMHSKANKVDLIGSVVEIDSEIPLSGSVVKLIGQNNTTLFSDQAGEFGTKLPTGTYQIVVEHPSYKKHISSLYIGNTTGRVKINLIPKSSNPVLAENKIPEKEIYEQKTINEAENPNKPKASENEVPVKEEPAKNYGSDDYFGNNIPNFEKENESTIEEIENPTKKSTEDAPEFTRNTETVPSEKIAYYEPPASKPEKVVNEEKHETPVENYSKNSPEEKIEYYQPPTSKPEENKREETYKTPAESYSSDTPKEKTTPYKTPIYKENEPEEIENTPTTYATGYKTPSQRAKEAGRDESDKSNLYYQPETDKRDVYKSPPTIEKTDAYDSPVSNSPSKLNNYTIKVVDDKSMVPIEDAQLFVKNINRNDAERYSTDGLGSVDLEIEKSDLRIVASADGYISNEIKISRNDEDGIYRIYLDPISNLFDEIYSKIDDKLANQYEDEVEIDGNNTADNTPIEKPIEYNSFNQDDDLAKNNIETNEEEIQAEIPEEKVKEIPKKEEKSIQTSVDEKLLQKQDSLENFIENLLAEQQAMMEKLDKVEIEKSNLEEDVTQKEAEKEALLAKAEKEAAEKERELLEKEALAKKEAEKANPELSRTNFAANNVVFLIDISSSMDKDNRLDLLKQSIKSLVPKLRDIDRVAIIAYNQKTDLVLESIEGTQKEIINNAIDSLKPYGLTYGVNGIQQAYEILEYYYRGDGNNQIILATDGLFSEVNQPISERELFKLVRQKANQENIKLSVVGFGKDDEGDNLMNKLASNGNGKFLKIKNPWEAETVLVREIEIQSKITP